MSERQICAKCLKYISAFDAKQVLNDKVYHHSCYVCAVCKNSPGDYFLYPFDGEVYCAQHFHQKRRLADIGPDEYIIRRAISQPLQDTRDYKQQRNYGETTIVNNDAAVNKALVTKGMVPTEEIDKRPRSPQLSPTSSSLMQGDANITSRPTGPNKQHDKVNSTKKHIGGIETKRKDSPVTFIHQKKAICAKCLKPVSFFEKKTSGDKVYHNNCFVCVVCNRPPGLYYLYNVNGELHCTQHLHQKRKHVTTELKSHLFQNESGTKSSGGTLNRVNTSTVHTIRRTISTSIIPSTTRETNPIVYPEFMTLRERMKSLQEMSNKAPWIHRSEKLDVPGPSPTVSRKNYATVKNYPTLKNYDTVKNYATVRGRVEKKEEKLSIPVFPISPQPISSTSVPVPVSTISPPPVLLTSVSVPVSTVSPQPISPTSPSVSVSPTSLQPISPTSLSVSVSTISPQPVLPTSPAVLLSGGAIARPDKPDGSRISLVQSDIESTVAEKKEVSMTDREVNESDIKTLSLVQKMRLEAEERDKEARNDMGIQKGKVEAIATLTSHWTPEIRGSKMAHQDENNILSNGKNSPGRPCFACHLPIQIQYAHSVDNNLFHRQCARCAKCQINLIQSPDARIVKKSLLCAVHAYKAKHTRRYSVANEPVSVGARRRVSTPNHVDINAIDTQEDLLMGDSSQSQPQLASPPSTILDSPTVKSTVPINPFHTQVIPRVESAPIELTSLSSAQSKTSIDTTATSPTLPRSMSPSIERPQLDEPKNISTSPPSQIVKVHTKLNSMVPLQTSTIKNSHRLENVQEIPAELETDRKEDGLGASVERDIDRELDLVIAQVDRMLKDGNEAMAFIVGPDPMPSANSVNQGLKPCKVTRDPPIHLKENISKPIGLSLPSSITRPLSPVKNSPFHDLSMYRSKSAGATLGNMEISGMMEKEMGKIVKIDSLEGEEEDDTEMFPGLEEVVEHTRGMSEEEHCRMVMKELITTETSYTKDLEDIYNGYQVKMSIMLGMALDELDILFGNIKDLAIFHRAFLVDLEKLGMTKQTLGSLFVQCESAFCTLYIAYCNNSSRQEAFLRTRSRQKSFQDILKKCQIELGHTLPLSTYLLKPVQRVLRYSMLLKEIVKYSSEDDDAECVRGLTVMEKVSVAVNEAKRMHELNEVFNNFKQNLVGAQRVNFQSFGSVIKMGKVKMTRKGEFIKHDRLLALFQNTLVMCRYDRASKYSIRERWDTYNMEPKDNKDTPLILEVLYTEGTKKNLYSFIFPNVYDKDDWLKTLQSELPKREFIKLAAGASHSDNLGKFSHSTVKSARSLFAQSSFTSLPVYPHMDEDWSDNDLNDNKDKGKKSFAMDIFRKTLVSNKDQSN